jgi:superfamily II DNA or RNA helicase
MGGFFSANSGSFSMPEGTSKKRGFRACQLGAIWAIRSHFTVSESHALISMPTGTGKTGVMIALGFALAPRRVFILAPTQLIRNQTAEKFRTLGLIREIGAYPRSKSEKPKVLELESRPKTDAEWRKLLTYDVVVATPQTVSPSYGLRPPRNFFGWDSKDRSGPELGFDLIFVDEAHHAPAKTWNEFLLLARRNRVVCLTATPFRTDRRRIKAQLVYTYGIDRAVLDGIYQTVDFEQVTHDDPVRRNTLMAVRAYELFLQERRKNPNAAVIVKARTIEEANQLKELYIQKGWKNLDIIHSDRSPDDNREVIDKVRPNWKSTVEKPRLDGFISVDMAGEGIDIPNLRIAVLHQAPKTLPYTIQLIGRVSRRTKGAVGNAVLIADPESVKGSEVEALYASDTGWSLILPQLFQHKLRQSRFEPDGGGRLSQLPQLMVEGTYIGIWLTGRFGLNPASFDAWRYLRSGIAIGFAVLAVELVYHFGPNVNQRFRDSLAGAIVAVGTWIGLSYLLGGYFRRFDNLGETYGPLGAAVGLYVWFYLSGFAILVGGEINFLLSELKNHRTPQSSNLAHTHTNNLNAAA